MQGYLPRTTTFLWDRSQECGSISLQKSKKPDWLHGHSCLQSTLDDPLGLQKSLPKRLHGAGERPVNIDCLGGKGLRIFVGYHTGGTEGGTNSRQRSMNRNVESWRLIDCQWGRSVEYYRALWGGEGGGSGKYNREKKRSSAPARRCITNGR